MGSVGGGSTVEGCTCANKRTRSVQGLNKVVSPPTALKRDGRAYSSVARCIIVAVPIGTDNTNRTKMGSTTPEQGSFPTVRTIGGRLRLQ